MSNPRLRFSQHLIHNAFVLSGKKLFAFANCVLLLNSLTGCKAYESTGRKSFEEKSQGKIQTNIGSQSVDMRTEHCWSPPENNNSSDNSNNKAVNEFENTAHQSTTMNISDEQGRPLEDGPYLIMKNKDQTYICNLTTNSNNNTDNTTPQNIKDEQP